MFIAHLPSGYLLYHGASTAGLGRPLAPPALLGVALLGSVLPDFDLIWFYAVDARQHLHHSYWTHIPFFWAVVGVAAWVVLRPISRRWAAGRGVLLGGVVLHLVLDTVAGGIRWAAPFSAAEFRLVDVPARYGWWVWNFVFHPSFLLELGLLAWALTRFRLARGDAQARVIASSGHASTQSPQA